MIALQVECPNASERVGPGRDAVALKWAIVVATVDLTFHLVKRPLAVFRRAR